MSETRQLTEGVYVRFTTDALKLLRDQAAALGYSSVQELLRDRALSATGRAAS